MESVNDSIFISYLDNSKIYDESSIEKLFLASNSLSDDNFDLGYYLVKVFIEKNFGLLMVRNTEDGIKYIIRFDKEV
jgi:two-component system sensor histidine kinase/response regulator